MNHIKGRMAAKGAVAALLALLTAALCLPAMAETGLLELPQALTQIGSGAFAQIGDVQKISVPAGVESIAEDAFSGCGEDVIFLCASGSYAQTWATEHGFTVQCAEGGFLYTVEDGTASITGYMDTDATEVVIPETLGGFPVRCIENYAFSDCRKITRVTIPPCVEFVGWYVFYQEKRFTVTICGELNSAAHLTAELEGYNFEPLDGSIKSGRYFYLIEDGEATLTSFDETNMRITSVTVPNTLGGCPVRRIGPKAFESTNLLQVTLPNGLREIGENAFNAGQVEKVTLPDSVERIGEHAFNACWDLREINLPTSLVYIGKSAFESCTMCSEITIPAGVQTIGENAFCWCRNLITVYLETDTVEIGSWAFDSLDTLNAATALVAGEGSTAQAYAQTYHTRFYPRGGEVPVRGLTSDGLYYMLENGGAVIIGYEINAFEDAFGDALTLPETAGGCLVRTLGERALAGSRIHSFTANAALRELGRNSLNGAQVLSVTLNEGLEQIGPGAFAYCRVLSSITIPSTVTVIDDGAFNWCDQLTSIAVPAGVTRIGSASFGYCLSLEQVSLSQGLQEIDDYAFSHCSSLETIELPDGVTRIGEGAFENSGLVRIVIPESVTEIAEDAFMYTSQSLVIVGKPGSCAHTYALDCAIRFEEI